MQFDDVIETRRSVHQYADDDIDDDVLRELLEQATFAPSSYNLQPWEFLVLRDEESKRRLREVAHGQEHVTDAAAVVVVLGNLDPSAHAERIARDKFEKGYLPDEDAVESQLETIERRAEGPREARRRWTRQSSTLAAMTLMHAAWNREIASCPMGGFDAEDLREAFDVSEEYEPVMLVTLGYPAEDAPDLERPRKLRRPVEEVVHFESFDPAVRPDAPPADD
ncbi:nitroreductase family protein [Haloplanus sp. GCM10025708]|uniref:nitroreductase family protein n=1 Tax=Haloferacaceae TaxID=1644056 RepID=UPI00361E6BA6